MKKPLLLCIKLWFIRKTLGDVYADLDEAVWFMQQAQKKEDWQTMLVHTKQVVACFKRINVNVADHSSAIARICVRLFR